MARSLNDVMAIVRTAARRLTGADGATFVLRENEYCFYADEDAISPLWKGSRFPLESCVSGWAMEHRQPAVIEDIYADDRIPHEAYRPTFVKSMVMVPIRTAAPIGAIGNYWATPHQPTVTEVRLLHALADSTAVAMENIQMHGELERRVEARTAQLGESVQVMRDFVAVAAHDLRGPLASVNMAAKTIQLGVSDTQQRQLVDIMERQSAHLVRLTDNLLTLSVIDAGQLDVHPEAVELGSLLELAASSVADRAQVTVRIAGNPFVHADPSHVQRMVDNLVNNAVKYGSEPIRITAAPTDGVVEISVIDRGPGVASDLVPQLFERFNRGNATKEKDGVGLGLSIVHELAVANGGTVSYMPAEPVGACFRLTLPAA